MRKFAFIFLFFSAPAFSAGLEIELIGENVEGVIKIIYETVKRINPNKKYNYFSS